MTTCRVTHWISRSFVSARQAGNIGEAELGLFAALVVVEREATGKMQGLIAIPEENVAKRRAGGTEGNGLQFCSIVRGQGEADVTALPYDLGKTRLVGREGE